MKTKPLPKFQSFDEAFQHIARLQALGYEPLGRWSLGQICNHLAESMDLMSGRLSRLAPRFIQRAFAGLFLRLTFVGKIGSRLGMRMPTVLPQKKPIDDAEGIRRLSDAIARMEALSPHLVAFHLWHATHHLSFLALSPQVDVAAGNGRATQASMAS